LNWKLAQYQLNHVIALFRIGATLRPKFTGDLNGFVKTHFHPMSEAIHAQDWRRFEEAFKKGIQGSDQFHEKYGYGFIHFVLPKNPPEMYDLTPRDLPISSAQPGMESNHSPPIDMTCDIEQTTRTV